MAPTARLRRLLSTIVMSSSVRLFLLLLCRQKPLLEAVKVKLSNDCGLTRVRLCASATVAGKCVFVDGRLHRESHGNLSEVRSTGFAARRFSRAQKVSARASRVVAKCTRSG